MPMNFWEAQRRAKRWTVLYLFCFLFLTVLVAVLSELALRYFAGPDNYNPPLPYLGILFLAVTVSVAIFYYLSFISGGGSYVARAVGAREVQPGSGDFQEQQLLNVVQEMALAAGLPMPPVFILETEQINAFAAGLHPDNAAVTVTRGALKLLSRDELQGVIAHEFGHIYNGDMKISMQLAAMVMGFFILFYLALRLSYFPSRRSNGNGRKGADPVALAILILFVAGSLTWFFGSVLKSLVSREREYLADACAVQFTRNPDGIAGALRKLMKLDQPNEMPKSGIGYSHLYFDDRSAFEWLFATHPPLKKRIEAIEARTYIPEEGEHT